MNEKGEMSALPCVQFTRLLPGSVDKVWTYLTDPHLLPQWFGDDSSIASRAGGAVRLMSGHIRGIVTQWRPPTKLVYTWNVFDPDDAAHAVSNYPESYLSFDLEQCGEDVRLRFTHFPVLERFVPQNAMGWHTMLDILGAGVRGEQVQDRSVYMQKNAAIYGVDLAKLAR